MILTIACRAGKQVHHNIITFIRFREQVRARALKEPPAAIAEHGGPLILIEKDRRLQG